MGSALAIRDAVPAVELRRLARLEDDGRVACRLLALANALEGMSRAGAAEQAGMDRQTLRDWVLRFNQAGVEGLRDRCRLVEDRFAVSYSENGMLRLLQELGLSWQKTRPVHPQADLKAQQAFKKSSRR